MALLDLTSSLPTTLTPYILALTLLLPIIYLLTTSTRQRPHPKIPIHSSNRNDYILNGRSLLQAGSEKFPGPFQVLTGTGWKIVFPNRYAQELANNPSLSFNDAHARDSFTDYEGLQPFREIFMNDTFIQEVVRKRLTQSLGTVMDGLVEEAKLTFHDTFGESKEWQTRLIKPDIHEIIARLSSRVFLGLELCRNRDWLTITKNYTTNSFQAISELRSYNALLRPVMQYFLTNCTQTRSYYHQARTLISPIVEKRRKTLASTIASNDYSASKASDAIGWMVECARGRDVDFAAAQLSLSLAAIHLSSETTMMCVLSLCEMPELAEGLRKEVGGVVRARGWSKQALLEMPLLDSFMRESMRTKDLMSASMHRYARAPVVLSDGTIIPKGATLLVHNNWLTSPEHFTNANKFDAERFLRLREKPGQENRHQYITPSPDMMGFGYGEHACPGRFFASNEIKTALCMLLLKYEFGFVPGDEPPQDIKHEYARLSHPGARVRIRKRQDEFAAL